MADRPDHDLADRLTDLADGGTAASTHSPECWRYHEHCAYLAAAARLRQLTERLGDSWYTDIGQRLDDVTAERDELRRQLDTLRNAGNPESIRLMADNLTGIGWTPEAEVMHAVADALAAVGDPEEGRA